MRTNINRILGLILFHGLLSGGASSAQEQVRRITLDEAIQLFHQNNLALRLTRAQAQEQTGVARQGRAYPNPVASVTHESISEQDLSYSETYYTITQPVDWPWRYANRRKAGSQRAAAATAELASDSVRLVFELKRTYVETAAAEALWQVLDQVVGVFRQAERSGSARFEEGDISAFELKRLRIERARYEQLSMEAELERARRRRQLTALTVPGEEAMQVAPAGPLAGEPPGQSLTPLLTQALARRGEIAAATASLGVAQASATVANWGRLPEPTITAGYKRQSDGFGGAFLGVALQLPLWDWKGGDVAAAAARVEAAQSREQLARIQVSNDVTTTAERYASLERRAELIGDELLSDVDDLLDVALLSYAEGELTLLELLDAARAFSEAVATKTRLQAAHWIAYYDLERAVGGFGDIDGERQEDR